MPQQLKFFFEEIPVCSILLLLLFLFLLKESCQFLFVSPYSHFKQRPI